MSIYKPDVIGSPTGDILHENIGTVIFLAPKAAPPLSATYRAFTVEAGAQVAYDKYQDRFHIPTILLSVSGC